MTSHLRAAVVTALALSLVAAGCGSKKANNYVDAVNKAQTDFVASVNKLQKAGTPTGIEGAQQTFKTLKTAVDKIVSDVKAANPPDKVKALHSQLVGELTSLDKAVSEAESALVAKDPQAILKAQVTFATKLGDLGSRVETTLSAINQKLH